MVYKTWVFTDIWQSKEQADKESCQLSEANPMRNKFGINI